MREFELSTDKKSDDYNPFYNGYNNIYPEPLTDEEMVSKGYNRGEYKIDVENGYYAWVYSYVPISPHCACYNKGEKL